MGGYVPNPVSVGILKLSSYAAFGWLVRRWSERPGNPVVFGAIRVGLGLLLGLGVLFIHGVWLERAGWSDRQTYLL